jgi:methylmalonyl-CoA mutase N-terminal domain/subunit
MAEDKTPDKTPSVWRTRQAQWREEVYEPFVRRGSERREVFATVSGLPLEPVYTPRKSEKETLAALGFPGEYPYTRGVYPSMYRGREWTRRQIAGFGTAPATNERYHFLLRQGQTGLSTDFDHPTLTGYSSTDPLAEGEVGRVGVAIDTVQDMDDLYAGIDINKISSSFTINHPACVLLPMYIAVAQGRGIAAKTLRGTVQNDALKEFYGQKTFALPPEPSVRLAIDIVEYCSKELPHWNAINVSGYHSREAGSTAVQEVAFTLAQGLAYAEALQARGLDLNVVLRNISFFFGCHMDFFEEAAKMRAARRLWARLLRQDFAITGGKAPLLRFHTQTLGSTLARNEPRNNIVRGTLQALASVLGGTQSLHISGYDEAYDIPSEDAMKMALRTQKIIAEESGVASIIDPLGGSYLVESLTDEIDDGAMDYLDRIKEMGEGSFLRGMFAGIDSGFFESEIVDASMDYYRRLESKDLIWVGENDLAEKPPLDESLELFQFEERFEDEQVARLHAFKKARNETLVQGSLRDLRRASQAGKNTIPWILGAVKAGVTEGEIMTMFREEMGVHRDPAVV